MLPQFQYFIQKKKLFKREDKILIALSGGLDSCVLFELFLQLGQPVGLAHCNFKLRGKEADEDEAFVKSIATQKQIPYYTTTFDTEKYARVHGISIQMAARDLRYEWLEKIRRDHNYQYIATAHHLNDSLETALFNFTKGTGLKGLLGIPNQNKHIIRPLLFATRARIEQFAQEHQLTWREDASNHKAKYARNKIRHQVIPPLKALNPQLENTAAQNFEILNETNQIYQYAIAQFRQQILVAENGVLKINKKILLEFPAPRSILYEVLKDYAFNFTQISNILSSAAKQVGTIIESGNHQLLNDRTYFILSKKEKAASQEYSISKEQTGIELSDATLTLEQLSYLPNQFPISKNIAYFDAQQLKFPLIIRHWKEGDWFQPLGMKGHRQKLQDYFSNQKLSRFEKDQVWILESAGQIVWVMSWRMDERFKIRQDTKEVLRISVSYMRRGTVHSSKDTA